MSPPLEPSPEARRAGTFASVVVGIIALLAMVGWLAPLPPLYRPFTAFPPLPFNAALGLLAAAAGLYGVASDRRPWIHAGAVLALLIGAATLLEYLSGVSFGIDTLVRSAVPIAGGDLAFSGRMPAASALSLVLASVALVVIDSPRWKPAGPMLAGTIGTIIAALAVTVLISYLTGVLSTVRSGALVGLAPHSAFAFGTFGVGLIRISWRRDASVALLPRWVPYSAGFAVFVTSMFLWQALQAAEDQQMAIHLRSVSEAVARRAASQVDGLVRPMRRRGSWIADQDGRHRVLGEWLTTARRQMADGEGLIEILWIDSTAVLVGTIKADGEEEPVMRAAEQEVRNALSRWGARGVPGAILTRLSRDGNAGPLLTIAVPNCGTLGCSGFTAAVLRPGEFLARGIVDIIPGYTAVLSAMDQILYRSEDAAPERQEPSAESIFQIAGRPWSVQIRPTGATARTLHSDLPIVVAGLGTVVSLLLAIALHLAQSTDSTARLTERARLAQAVESATDGLWERNLLTGESSRSPAVWRRLGYERKDVDSIGSLVSWETLVHPEDRGDFDARLREHLAGVTESFEIEYRVEARNGDWHWIVDRGKITDRDERGRAVRIVGICADVTERKHSDRALAASEQRFRTMFDRGFQLEHLLDVNCHLLEANRTSLEFARVTLDEVRGKTFWETPWWAGHEERQQRLKCACEEALNGKTVRYQEELRGPENQVKLVDFSLTPIIDSEGRVIQLLAEGRDISDRQRVDATLRELDTLSTMGRLAARVAHEINNPLAGIQNSFLLIKGAIPETHPYFSYVGAIEREIARMAAITRQLYETYRPDGDGREDASVPILISDAVTMLEQVNRAAGVHIQVDTSGSPAILKIPGALLRQSVYNLVQNAVEASPHGGTVWVKAWRADQTFWLSVTDQGPGVPKDIRDQVFEPFVTTKSGIRTGGMGLGLSLVKRSVQALGGRIELIDPAAGGAEFRIAIPLR